jgi:regulator of cell morphogenesis and NO signaling
VRLILEETMESTTPILPTMDVNEAIRRFPETIAVFNAFGIDACCGGAAPIAEAAGRDGADPARLLEALNAAARP